MRKWLKSLFGQDAGAGSGSTIENSMQVNEVLARYRPAQTATGTGREPAKQRTADPETANAEREPLALDFGESGLSLADATGDEGINPYDTGPFTASELWEKRHRSRLT